MSRAGSKAASFIPGWAGSISKSIGTARKAATAVMEARGTPYLPEEEKAADALAATLLDESEPSGCRALVTLLEQQLRAPAGDAWAAWLHVHGVSAERVEALTAPCPEPERS